MSSIRHILMALASVVAMIATSAGALADVIKLKDGRTLTGEIIREVDGYIWIKHSTGGIEATDLVRPDEVDSIERDAGAAPVSAEPVRAKEPTSTPRRTPGVPRAAVISLGEGGDKDMVGVYMTAESLRRLIPILEQDQIDIVVFKINSGGGLLLEIQRLSDVIQNEFKPKFQVVAWIESAISAAAMTAHCIEDIYFMPEGNYGACTGWSGQLVAVKGRGLEEVLYKMELISARGRHAKEIMRSMQIDEPLSATFTPDGDVKWYNTEEGEYLVNPKGRILTFNANDAVKYHFAKGVAKTYQELGRAMGYREVDWVGKIVPGVPYPICRAEEEMQSFRNQTYQDQVRTNEYFVSYQSSVEAARGEQDRKQRGAMVNRARQALRRIERMVANNPNFALLTFNMPDYETFKDWVRQQDEFLDSLMK